MAYGALLVYVALLFIRPQEWISFIYGWPILDFVTAAAVVTWLGSIKGSRWRLRDAPQNWLMLGLFAAVLMSHVAHTYFAAFTWAFQEFGKVVLLYFLVVSLVDSVSKARTFVSTIILGCLFLSAWGLYQAWSPDHFGFASFSPDFRAVHQDETWRVRALGIFNDPNDLALMLVAVLPFLLSDALSSGRSPGARIAAAGAAVPMLWCIFLTNSRGGWLALGVMLAAYAAIHLRSKQVGVALGLVVFLAIFSLGPSRVGMTTDDESSHGRWAAWGEGNRMLKQWPAFGAGQGRFTEFSDHSRVAHNSFVHCYAELGLFGYFFWFGLVVASLKDGWALSRDSLQAAVDARSASAQKPSAAARSPASWAMPAMAGSPVHSDLSPGNRREVEETAQADAIELRRLAKAGTAGLVGYLAAAFFLSRTYNVPLYILFAFLAASRTMYEKRVGTLPHAFVRRDCRYVLAGELASVPAIYLLTRFLN